MARDLNVRRLIVVVHGDSRNAIDHERYVVQAAAGAGVTDAVIVAPQFLLLGDLTTNGLPTSTLYWDDGWKSGMPSASSPSPRPWSISSFAVIDQLIRLAASSFPNVQQITIVGHSAGGQFANRYAAESLIVAEVPRTYRFVAANPGSYVYLSADRYHLATDAFAALTTTEASACPRFNRYKHGLDLLNPYGAAVGASTIQTQYAQRAVTYLLGALDTDGSDPSLDTSCAAMWEGAQRLERGQLYYRYLTETYGSGITDRQHLAIVAGVAHDAKAIYNSATGLAVLFP